MTPRPAAYLRRSQEGGITKDDELAQLRALAHREGHNGELVIYDDWGHSADEAKDSQDRLRDLIADMRGGRVSVVYAGKVDRLIRSVAVFARFAAAAKEHDVRLVTLAEGDMSEAEADKDPFKWASRQFMVTMAEMELRTIKARSRRSQRIRQERGDRFGHAPYGFRHAVGPDGRVSNEPDPTEPLELIRQAFVDAGSILGAVRLLEQRGIRSPHGKPTWSTASFTRVLRDNWPDLMPRHDRPGRPPTVPAALAGILRCHCGRVMTPNHARGQYYCWTGLRQSVAVHGRASLSERQVMPWLKAEAARLRTPERVSMETDAEDRGEAIRGRLERAHELYIAGDIDRSRYDAEKARAAADLAALQAEQAIVAVPALDWTWPPETVNGVLRAMWSRVELGPDMRPVRAEWIIPEWRTP